VSALEGIASWRIALTLGAEPSLMRADDLAAVGVVFQIGRNRRLRQG
jgi:hypothetical protein